MKKIALLAIAAFAAAFGAYHAFKDLAAAFEDLDFDDVDDEESLVFFEVTELNFLTIKFKEENELGQCPIYSDSTKIADSLEEFLNKMVGNPDYYI